MSFAAALNMNCNTQKHTLNFMKNKKEKYYDFLEIDLHHPKAYSQTQSLNTKKKRKDIMTDLRQLGWEEIFYKIYTYTSAAGLMQRHLCPKLDSGWLRRHTDLPNFSI